MGVSSQVDFGPATQSDPGALFVAAVRAGATGEVDWMWLYAQMTGSFERLYCLEKALARDPQNAHMRDELRRLAAGR